MKALPQERGHFNQDPRQSRRFTLIELEITRRMVFSPQKGNCSAHCWRVL